MGILAAPTAAVLRMPQGAGVVPVSTAAHAAGQVGAREGNHFRRGRTGSSKQSTVWARDGAANSVASSTAGTCPCGWVRGAG